MKTGRKQSEKIQQKIHEFIPLLRRHPEGLSRRQIREKLSISNSMFEKLLYNTADYPIGYDNRFNDNYYWVGR